ncbi:MAG TPA: saccharopine dehydrogenase NADP-binding domain-containing protein, partial [Steroidobacteraceae bacterium]
MSFTHPLKVLIVGGYGTFGGRLVDLLSDEARLVLIVTGRSTQRAVEFCSPRTAQARLVATEFDRDGDVGEQLRKWAPNVLVDASGPFQSYGNRRYELIEACIAQHVQYLDLADAAEFVDGVSAFDAAARSAGVSVLSGVSSFP